MGLIDTNLMRGFSPDKLGKLSVFDTAQMFCDVYCLEPGQSQKPHAHAGATKFYFVIEGEPTLVVGAQQSVLRPGGLAWAAPGEVHGVANHSPARAVLLVAMGPSPNHATSPK